MFCGCTQTIQLTANTAQTRQPYVEKRWQSHFLLGFVGRSELDLRDHCQSGTVSEVDLTHNYATIIVWAVTFGIYTPRRIIVVCQPQGKTP
jgi:hypothetical protein